MYDWRPEYKEPELNKKKDKENAPLAKKKTYIESKPIQRCLPTLEIRKMQIEDNRKYRFIPTRLAKRIVFRVL